MIGQTIAHYKITAKLGEGGMGEVYLAMDTTFDRPVAVKFLSSQQNADATARQRFLHEAKAQAMLNHPNVTTFLDSGEHAGRAFIVMEYVEGQPLDVCVTGMKLSTAEILDLVRQIAEGLEAAHERGVIHRDIKPQNILVTAKRRVKITDFGLARWQGASTLTRTGTQMGTVHYMSPEQTEGKRVDHRADIFSLGVILYELICARKPFDGDNPTAISYAIVSSHPQPIARYSTGVPEELQQVVDKCLAKNPDERYQSVSDLLADLRRVQRQIEGHPSTASRPVETRSLRRYLKYAVATSAVLVAALIVLILKPWRFDVVSDQRASASENSLAIMYFDNMSDPGDSTRVAQMITSLLITDLSESQYMKVVSRQRLYEILKQLGHEGETRINERIAFEVAKRAGVRFILTGEILQLSPRIALSSQISQVQRGEIVSSQRVNGGEGEDIFSVVDKLSAAVREDLSLPSAAQAEPDRPVAEVTTHSPEAYRAYAEGLNLVERFFLSEAELKFLEAIRLDSTFAMAHLQMARLKADTDGNPDPWIDKASRYSDRTSWKEQKYIMTLEAGLRGDNSSAVSLLTEVIERYPQERDAYYYRAQATREGSAISPAAILDLLQCVQINPSDKIAYNELAYAFDRAGNLDSSIWAINRYIELAPDEPNPYDSRGDLYANNGHIDEAILSYHKALEIRPDFMSREKLGGLYIFKGEYERADSLFREMTTSPDKGTREVGRACRSLVPAHRGQFRRSLEIMLQADAAERLETPDTIPVVSVGTVACYQSIGDYQAALHGVVKLREKNRNLATDAVDWPLAWQVSILCQLADTLRAWQLSEELLNDIRGKDTTRIILYWGARAKLELACGRPEAAVGWFEQCLAQYKGFNIAAQLGGAYLATGQYEKAIRTLEDALSRYDLGRINEPEWNGIAMYLLARAYEESGWRDRAVEQYSRFLAWWKDADVERPEIVDARARLLKLRKESS
jgi:serine/threonine protein kinase/Flp pilus assembly protein TadD